MTVRQLDAVMDSAELSEWLAFDNLYNLPDEFFLAEVLSQVVARVSGNRTRPGDFVPYFRPEVVVQSTDSMLAQFVGWAAAHNFKVARDGEGG